ncbi:unnamed protein product [Thlaspi arvense]|uniref:PPM-type phosphatase domain-containing protein n=1 Tax=Thlaspi arvense TaxID=13288 RepID=A0AAU9SFC1_THLAR|nr:unnamed protein product [Thlaspi arvense]
MQKKRLESSFCSTSTVPSKKIADAKLAKDFQAVLKEFQKAQQTAAERETAYTPFVPPSATPSSYTASEEKVPEQRAQVMESRRQELVLLDNEAVIKERESKGRVFALQDEPEVARVWLPNSDSPGLAMARAFGDFCLKDYGLISVPDINYHRLTERDHFIILVSDRVNTILQPSIACH